MIKKKSKVALMNKFKKLNLITLTSKKASA